MTASHAFADFTRRVTVSLPAASGSTRVAAGDLQLFHAGVVTGDAIWYRPQGFEMPAAATIVSDPGVAGFVKPSQFPVLLNATLPPDWEQLPLYLTLSRWERRSASATPAVYLSPPDLRSRRRRRRRRVAACRATSRTCVERDVPGGWQAARWMGSAALAAGAYAYLARFQERPLTAWPAAGHRGQPETGRPVGWLAQQRRWASQSDDHRSWPLRAALEVPADGNYSFVIANNLKGSSLRNVCEFTRLAWLP